VGTLAAGAGFAVEETIVAQKRADLEESLLLASQNPGDPLPYLERATSVREDLESARDLRRAFGYGALGIYAANLVDALLLSLRHGGEEESQPSLSATFGPDGPEVALRLVY
jgi:hypothetical protein